MKLILVPLDGSPNSHNVLAGALDLANKTEAKLLLFHAVTLPTQMSFEAYAVAPDRLQEALVESAKKVLESLARTVPAARLAGVRVELGTPWRAICDAAKAEKVDLIAIGSHGYGVLDRLLGTTAARIVNHADRSVLVVRAIELLDELLDKK